MKQGGDTNTIEVVNGIRDAIGTFTTFPSNSWRHVVFDQSAFVKEAIKTLLHEGLIGLVVDERDDSDFPGQLARDHGGVSFHSAFRARHIRGA